MKLHVCHVAVFYIKRKVLILWDIYPKWNTRKTRRFGRKRSWSIL